MGYSAPEIYAEDMEAGLLLLEDFGDTTFTLMISASVDEKKLYECAIDLLIDLHSRPKYRQSRRAYISMIIEL